MKIDGVVVVYNAEDSIIENIKTYIDFIDTLYIVDNSDNINSLLVDRITDISSKCVYVDNKGNQGIAHALNLGARLAIENKADWLLTMDQDTSFYNDDVKCLIDIMLNISNDSFAIIAPSHYHNENTINRFYNTVTMTSGNLLNLNIYKKLNGFDESLFIDSVDIDYCLKAYSNNYLIKRTPSIILKHNLGNIKKYSIFGISFSPSNHNYLRRYYITRNRLYIWNKYKSIYPEYIKFEKVISIKEFIKIILFEDAKFKKILFIIKGYKDFKKGKFGRY